MMRFAKRLSIFSRIFRLALALVYRGVFLLSQRTFYRKRKPLQSHVVIVGSFLAGGAGKTPLVRELVHRMNAESLRVAILCHSAAWDEFRMLRSEFGSSVLKTRNRYRTARQIDGSFDVIVCDGGLEDTRFADADTFVLRWGESATSIADLIPSGNCVSLEKDHPGAREIRCLRLSENRCEREYPASDWSVSFGISTIRNGKGTPLPRGAKCLIVTAIGNPERLAKDVEAKGICVTRRIFLPDHSKRFARILRPKLNGEIPVVMTEKDWVRLPEKAKENPLLYLARERVSLGKSVLDYLNAAAGGAFKKPPSTL